MAFSTHTYSSVSAAQQVYTIPFPFLRDAHITVLVDEVAVAVADRTVGSPSASEVTIISPVIVGGENVTITRSTPIDDASALVDFSDPSTLRRTDLDTLQQAHRYAIQEIADDNTSGLQFDAVDNKWDGESYVIKDVADPASNSDVATKNYVDAQVISSGVVPPMSISEALFYLRVNQAGNAPIWVESPVQTYLFQVEGAGTINTGGDPAAFTGQALGWYLPPNGVNFIGDTQGEPRAPLTLIDSYVPLAGADVTLDANTFDITVGAGQWIIEAEAHMRGVERVMGSPTGNTTYGQIAITDSGGAPLGYSGGITQTAESNAFNYVTQVGNDGTLDYTVELSPLAKVRYHADFGGPTIINLRGRSSTSAEVGVCDPPTYLRITRWNR